MTEIEVLLYEHGDVKKRIRELELQISELEEKKESIYDRLLDVKPLTGDRVIGGPLYDPVVEAVSKLVDVYAKRIRTVTLQLDEANEKLAKIESLTKRLTETERRCIQLRYYDGLPVWKVAQNLGYCERQTSRIKNQAIKKMSDHVRFYAV